MNAYNIIVTANCMLDLSNLCWIEYGVGRITTIFTNSWFANYRILMAYRYLGYNNTLVIL